MFILYNIGQYWSIYFWLFDLYCIFLQVSYNYLLQVFKLVLQSYKEAKSLWNHNTPLVSKGQ